KVAAPKIDADVAMAIETCLMKDRDDRWKNGRLMSDALSNGRERNGIARVVRRLTNAAAAIVIGGGIPALVSTVRGWV
ncbi:MAG: hypothetical protein ABIR92_08725, partial [Gemmatimonadaceae bacterium]